MSMKRKIDKAAYDALSDEMKAAYKKVKNDYLLDIEASDEDGDEDTGTLRRAKEREKQRADDFKKELEELKAKLADDENVTARKKGDIETLERSWQKKYDDTVKEKDDLIAKKDNFIKSTLVDNKAIELANKLSTSPQLLIPHIKARLSADLDGDVPSTKVLDVDGKISALTIDDLSKELVANKDFSAIIIGSKANGSGAGSNGLNRQDSGAKPKTPNNEVTDWSKSKPADLAASLKDKVEAG